MSRDAVLGAVRQSLGRGPLTADARRELDQRIAEHRANLIPARGQGERAEQLALFVEMAEGVSCTVQRLASAAEIPAAVTEYLRGKNLPLELGLAPDPELKALPWGEQPMLALHEGRARNQDLASLTPAFAGIAETGTLMMTSGETHPTTLNFMPDHHIVAMKSSQVVGAYEEAWARLREARGDGDGGFTMPRTVNLITGPSRTGDIELTIHLGAHGPRSLHILLIDDESGERPAE
jgi:L-lactate dehydrogenase complex protein LldG